MSDPAYDLKKVAKDTGVSYDSLYRLLKNYTALPSWLGATGQNGKAVRYPAESLPRFRWIAAQINDGIPHATIARMVSQEKAPRFGEAEPMTSPDPDAEAQPPNALARTQPPPPLQRQDAPPQLTFVLPQIEALGAVLGRLAEGQEGTREALLQAVALAQLAIAQAQAKAQTKEFPEIMTPGQAAEYLQVSVSTLRRHRSPSFYVGTSPRYRKSDL